MNSNNNFPIRVAIRTRPLLTSDCQRIPTSNHGHGLAIAVHPISDNNSILVVDQSSSNKPTTHQFFFDKVFQPEDTNEEVYSIVAKHIVSHSVKGYNGTVFGYGQTSTGKTHTIFGHSSPGIVGLAVDDLFDQIEAANKKRMFFVRLAVLEIYNERLTDLAAFDPDCSCNNSSVRQQTPTKAKPLRIRETPDGFIFVENLVEEVCTNRESASEFLNDCLTRRHMAQTHSNRDSSRSHVICRIVVESRPTSESRRPSQGDNLDDCDQAPTTIGELNFVDLAGSECAVKILNMPNDRLTYMTGNVIPPETVLRLKEGRAINRSLLMLGIVIGQLSESRPVVNYRNSKLTRILQNALGGNSLTAIICTLSPIEADRRQTVGTLQFGNSAKSIKTKPRLNETFSPDQAVLRRLQLEIERLRRRIVELEMQQSFSSANLVDSSTGDERQQLHENERLLSDLIAGGRRPFLANDCYNNNNKPPVLLRRMTWAPTGSGHAVLMFTDKKDRPESSRLAAAVGETTNKPVIFDNALDKAMSSVDSPSQANSPSSTSQDSSSLTNNKSGIETLESISATIGRIENEMEFRERFVGRQYFDFIAKNYEKLKNVLEQSLGARINEEDDFTDVSDKISMLKSRQNTQISSSTSSAGRSPDQQSEGDEARPPPPPLNIVKPSSYVPPIPLRIIRRSVASARLPPIVVQSSYLRTKSASSAGASQSINHPYQHYFAATSLLSNNTQASTSMLNAEIHPEVNEEEQDKEEDNGADSNPNSEDLFVGGDYKDDEAAANHADCDDDEEANQ